MSTVLDAPKQAPRVSRRQQILQCLAEMLESDISQRITTAKLAEAVGVSEAALYRHFPSKARMFEGLIEFIEEAIFSRVKMILNEEQACAARTGRILSLILTFAAKNPGLTRIMTRDALLGENERLGDRIAQFFDRVELQLKQVLREAELHDGEKPAGEPAVLANMLLAFVEGRLQQFVRSHFKQSPLENWESQWMLLRYSLLAG